MSGAQPQRAALTSPASGQAKRVKSWRVRSARLRSRRSPAPRTGLIQSKMLVGVVGRESKSIASCSKTSLWAACPVVLTPGISSWCSVDHALMETKRCFCVTPQAARREPARRDATAGKRRPISSEMMAIATRISTMVNARRTGMGGIVEEDANKIRTLIG